MAKAKIKTFEEAQAATTEAKASIKEAKGNLTAYYKDNKLKRKNDYSEDKKHGKKIGILERKIERANDSLTKAQAAVKDLKPATVRKTTYDYPDDIDTPELRKKYRQKQRAASKKGDKPAKKSSKKASKKEAPAKGSSKKASKKKGSKKSKKSDD